MFKIHLVNVCLYSCEEEVEREKERICVHLSWDNLASNFDSVPHIFCRHFKDLMPSHFLAMSDVLFIQIDNYKPTYLY
jgi:hypothetical protein